MGPHWQAPGREGGSTALLWWPRFPGGPGGAGSGPSSEQPFPHPLTACAQSVTVYSEQSKSEALPHRNWLPQAQPTGEGPAAGHLFEPEAKHSSGFPVVSCGPQGTGRCRKSCGPLWGGRGPHKCLPAGPEAAGGGGALLASDSLRQAPQTPSQLSLGRTNEEKGRPGRPGGHLQM